MLFSDFLNAKALPKKHTKSFRTSFRLSASQNLFHTEFYWTIRTYIYLEMQGNVLERQKYPTKRNVRPLFIGYFLLFNQHTHDVCIFLKSKQRSALLARSGALRLIATCAESVSSSEFQWEVIATTEILKCPPTPKETGTSALRLFFRFNRNRRKTCAGYFFSTHLLICLNCKLIVCIT